MANRYNNGKIYKLVNNVDDKIYIGSSCGSLAKRKSKHKSCSKIKPNIHVYKHLNEVGWKNVKIILIESVIAENKDQLLMREQHYIDLLKPSLNSTSAIYNDCPHNKRKDQCKSCGGVAFCHHGREKFTCKICVGSGICSHNRRRSECIECGGVSICDHARIRSRCKDCNKDKYYCYECNKNFCSNTHLKRHELGVKHIETYNTMLLEVFGE